MEFRKVTKLSFKEITSDLEATFYRLRLLDSTNIYSGPFSKILDFLASKKFFYFSILQTRIDFILLKGRFFKSMLWLDNGDTNRQLDSIVTKLDLDQS